VILEAWAAKTAFVACASAGPAAHVTDGVNGLLTPIGDAGALRNAIFRIISDNGLRQDLIENGYKAYLQDFTPEAVTKRWIDFYAAVEGDARPAKIHAP
jgi:glycosyltransferase involved in cell wall biosynthesis